MATLVFGQILDILVQYNTPINELSAARCGVSHWLYDFIFVFHINIPGKINVFMFIKNVGLKEKKKLSRLVLEFFLESVTVRVSFDCGRLFNDCSASYLYISIRRSANLC